MQLLKTLYPSGCRSTCMSELYGAFHGPLDRRRGQLLGVVRNIPALEVRYSILHILFDFY